MDNEDHEPINMTDILSQASDLDAISARKLIYNEITKIIKRSPIMKKKFKCSEGKSNYYCAVCSLGHDEVEKLYMSEEIWICNECIELAIDLADDKIITKKVKRYIEFSPEHRQAGIGILSFFSSYLDERYPNTDAKVIIQQNGSEVKMTIETSDGDPAVITRTLEEYASVITGKSQPGDFIDDPMAIMKLQQRLQMAVLELKWASDNKAILERMNDSLNLTVKTQAEQIADLNKSLQRGLSSAGKLADAMKALSTRASDATVQIALNRLLDMVEQGLNERDEDDAKRQLGQIQQADPKTYGELCELAHNMVTGTSASLLANWIGALNSVLPS